MSKISSVTSMIYDSTFMHNAIILMQDLLKDNDTKHMKELLTYTVNRFRNSISDRSGAFISELLYKSASQENFGMMDVALSFVKDGQKMSSELIKHLIIEEHYASVNHIIDYVDINEVTNLFLESDVKNNARTQFDYIVSLKQNKNIREELGDYEDAQVSKRRM